MVRAFIPADEKQKGLLTRIMENDPQLSLIVYEKSREAKREEEYYEELRASLLATGRLISEDGEH